MDLSPHACGPPIRLRKLFRPAHLGAEVEISHSYAHRRTVQRLHWPRQRSCSVVIHSHGPRAIIRKREKKSSSQTTFGVPRAAPGRRWLQIVSGSRQSPRERPPPGSPRGSPVASSARPSREPAKLPDAAESSPRHLKPALERRAVHPSLAARRRAEEEEDVHARRPSGARPRARFGYYQRRRGAGRPTRRRRRAAARRGRAAEPGRASRPARATRK